MKLEFDLFGLYIFMLQGTFKVKGVCVLGPVLILFYLNEDKEKQLPD